MASFQPYLASQGPGHHQSSGNRRRVPQRSHLQKQHQQQMFRAQVLASRDVSDAASATSQGPANMESYRESLEQWISFDLEDDMEFCPNLVGEDDWLSQAASDRSSMGSNSLSSSPTQQPQMVATGYLNAFSASFLPPAFQPQNSLPIHQPTATRAIAIIDPTTGLSVASPTPSVSPNRLQRNVSINMPKW